LFRDKSSVPLIRLLVKLLKCARTAAETLGEFRDDMTETRRGDYVAKLAKSFGSCQTVAHVANTFKVDGSPINRD
ncbi:MAG: hypothetical protein Q8M16_21945, partial [Pirellulaceae bacterium]|nr:hypothetical protein [Pirellulaceae bacterium]